MMYQKVVEINPPSRIGFLCAGNYCMREKSIWPILCLKSNNGLGNSFFLSSVVVVG
jgi:hypothetical protein